MKQDILLLNCSQGFNENQTWITFLPFNYTSIYSHTEKFNGLKIFNLEKKFRIRVDKNILSLLDENDFLHKCSVEYELINNGNFNDYYKFTKLTIGSKVIDLTK